MSKSVTARLFSKMARAPGAHVERGVEAEVHDGVRHLVHEDALVPVATARQHEHVVLRERRHRQRLGRALPARLVHAAPCVRVPAVSIRSALGCTSAAAACTRLRRSAPAQRRAM